MAEGGNVIFKFLGDDKQLKSTMGDLNKLGKKAFKGIVAGTTAVTASFGAIVTASVKARGEMEQLEGGVKKIFDEMDYSKIEKDAVEAYKTMNLSASEYMQMINSVGATFAQTMGDQKGYETAKKGLQAIADYASGTGADVNTLNDKFKMISRSTSSYLSIADQFAGILPQTTKDFLAQAQASGFLSEKYKKLTDVPVAEYQQAISSMLEQGVDKMNLLGNTAAESETTLTGSIAMMKKSWENFLSGKGSLGDVVESMGLAFTNILNKVNEAMPQIASEISKNMPLIIETGMNLIGALAKGLMDNLPLVLSTAGDVIKQIGSTLYDNMDTILEQGIEIILSIIDGISESLPNLVPKVVDIIAKIATTLLQHAPQIVDAGMKLIIKLGEGLIKSIPNMVISLGQVTTTIIDTFFNLIRQAPSWGLDMIKGFGDGIMGALGTLKEKVGQVADGIRAKLHFSRPDEGPLRDYETWMPDMIKGMANSLEKASPILLDKISALTGAMSPTLNGNVNNNMSPVVNVVVNNSYETDPLGQIVSKIKTFSNGAKNDYNYGYGG